ncbi:hypothetical protein D3C86_2155840 [compost metagenome]
MTQTLCFLLCIADTGYFRPCVDTARHQVGMIRMKLLARQMIDGTDTFMTRGMG